VPRPWLAGLIVGLENVKLKSVAAETGEDFIAAPLVPASSVILQCKHREGVPWMARACAVGRPWAATRAFRDHSLLGLESLWRSWLRISSKKLLTPWVKRIIIDCDIRFRAME
jgi:hypothetical protein